MTRRVSSVLMVAWMGTVAAVAHPPGADGRHEHPDPEKIRAWTNVRTGETVNGAFLAARSLEGVLSVSIERANGDVVVFAFADLGAADRSEAQRRIDEVATIQTGVAAAAAVVAGPPVEGASPATPRQAAPFNAFSPFVSTRWDERWLYIESDGLPHEPGSKPGGFAFSHPMMIGITAWQQQVPLPQSYRGSNAWRIPLKPEIAEKPVSAREHLFRGAIALAANGVPIFNPIKNDGKTDTFLAGELDDFGGHCGRADDYHYHIAPTHLQKYVGKSAPIAYALDGFPIYGLFDATARPGGVHADKSCPLGGTDGLDELNGHYGAAPANSPDGTKGPYHYHASAKYPYLNGGMRGVVAVKDDQIDPQPRASSPRAALTPLRGARITGFKWIGKGNEPGWSLEYLLGGKKSHVNYRLVEGRWIFDFVDPTGGKKSETYDGSPKPPRQGRGGGSGEGPQRRLQEPAAAGAVSELELTSPDVVGGRLAVDCTCDGKGVSPALSWGEPPAETKAFAVVMDHVAPDGETHAYVVVTNIPGTARGLKNGDPSGVWGQNSVNRRAEYAPPCSQGPGEKTYTIRLYALSAESPVESPAKGSVLTRESLLKAIKGHTVAVSALEVTYSRATADGKRGPAEKDGQPVEGERRRGGGNGGGGERGGGLLARMTAFKTDVPAHDMDVVLARPTDRSITVSVSTNVATRAMVEYWPEGSGQKRMTEPVGVTPGAVENIELAGLREGTEYRYRVGQAGEPQQPEVWGAESRFRTRPAPGTPFSFVIQADSHLDQGVEPKVYEQTLANMLAAKPDFVIDLGDTFMTDKRGQDFKASLAQYDAQRYYFGLVAHSVPLFMVLGNHDGEKGTSGRSADDIGPWSYVQRTRRFPAPVIDGAMYTGSTSMSGGVGSNYYAFEWGDAQFIILDPFWSTTDRVRGGAGGGGRSGGGEGGPRAADEPLKPVDASWAATLGRAQYDWLKRTLEASRANYRFVFIHHLVGGLGGAEARGGVESSLYFEWGGRNADGSPGFAEHRPGWSSPIHDLLVQHSVSAVFHGHDHLYVSNQRDGVVYQCVPQPGNPRGNTRTSSAYGYSSGTVHGSPGHLRVGVAAEAATVEFVRTRVDDTQPASRNRETRDREPNGSVVARYRIASSSHR